jgi:succinate dehydrogenase / fumarate reductase membrane anchor subunit
MGNGTSIGRVRGLGSSKHGAQHWLVQRFTAIGNIVLIPFLIFSLALMPDLNYDTVRAWLAKPVPATAVVLIFINTFYHARLGVQVLMEDYLHEHGTKFAALTLLNLLPLAGGALGILFVLRVALGGA